MAEIYEAANEQGKIFGNGNPRKVYAGTKAISTGDTLTIPGASKIISVILNPDSSTTVPTWAGNVITITVGAGAPVTQILVIYQ